MKIIIDNHLFFDELYFQNTDKGFYKILYKFSSYNLKLRTPSLSVLYRFHRDNFRL